MNTSAKQPRSRPPRVFAAAGFLLSVTVGTLMMALALVDSFDQAGR